MEEALTIAGRCEMAREALKMDYVSTQVRQPPTESGAAAMVHSISDGGGLHRAMDSLTADMREMRMEMRQMAEENNRLKASRWRDEQKAPHPVHGGQCQCTCGERGCQSRPWGEQRGPSPHRGWHERGAGGGPREKQDYWAPYNNRTNSPNWRDRCSYKTSGNKSAI